MGYFKEFKARRERFERLRNFVLYRGEDKYKLKDVLPFPIGVWKQTRKEDQFIDNCIERLLSNGPGERSVSSYYAEERICDEMTNIALLQARRNNAKQWWRRIYIYFRNGERYYPFERSL